ncbi:MAG: type VI secretion system tip protein TssI/VgrG, partial [Pseudomonadota bacterium]
EVDRMSDAVHPGGDIESYDWPGDYLKQGEGRGVVNRRVEAERGQAPRHQAEGDVVSLGAGLRITLRGDEVPGATGRTFVCLKAQHRFRAQGYGTGDAGGDETPYFGSYVMMPDDTPYRPERRTIGPRVQGPETAVVVGDGEIDCDQYGRILCRFHWDLDGAHTMRVRVSQNWASKGWGGMVIPRIGMEVIVEHLRGDPDKPIVTGCVFNGKNDVPYALPEHKTKSVFRSDSHQSSGFNEISFDDRTGDEQIFIHAELDKDVVVKNDLREWVQNDAHFKVDHNKNEDVKNDKSSAVGSNRMDATAKTHSSSVGKDRSVSVGEKFSVVAGESVFLQGANTAVFESKGDLIIKAPGGFIRIGADGITIRGTKVNINSGGSPFNGVPGEAISPQPPDKAKVKD